jgi:hypothetical protein
MIAYGTVLTPGENHATTRVLDAAGPWFLTEFQGMWEFYPDVLDPIGITQLGRRLSRCDVLPCDRSVQCGHLS